MPPVCFYNCPICKQQTIFTDPAEAYCEYCASDIPHKPRRVKPTPALEVMKPRRALKSQRRRRKNRRPNE